jgi:hypothetical protein
MNRREKELKVWEYFIPSKWKKDYVRTDEGVKSFFEYSERGKKRLDYNGYININELSKDDACYVSLLEGKRWAQIHVGMYEEGIMEGTMPYILILEEMIEEVMEFFAKNLFKGKDKELIHSLWKSSLKS